MVKNPPANAGDERDASLIPGLGKSPEVGNVNPPQLPEKFHGWRKLVVQSPWGSKNNIHSHQKCVRGPVAFASSPILISNIISNIVSHFHFSHSSE